MDSYQEFLKQKLAHDAPSGFSADVSSPHLFDYQRDLTRWALHRGRAAIFASTGLGKTRMELEWARQVTEQTKLPVLLLAPLAVAAQTEAEARILGVNAAVARESAEIHSPIVVTNYERLHRFDTSIFGGVVLDESSCIKHHTSKTLQVMLDSFARTPYRLAATATPAPNDWVELGTHAEFLGVCSREEMLAEFFTHDGGETQAWRLKGHAQREFWRWVASWGALVRNPEDLGYDGSAHRLPTLITKQHTLAVETHRVFQTGQLFPDDNANLMERKNARRESLTDRVAACAAIVNASDEPWVVWCDLNAEGDALTEAIPDAVEVRGSDDIDTKEERLRDFAAGRTRVLVTKSSIAGFGLNWQHCARMAFVGLTDSWESYFQAVRRCWRFGQTREVHVHVFASELEGAVVRNIERKARDAEALAESLAKETASVMRSELRGRAKLSSNEDHKQKMKLPPYITTRGA